LQWQDPHHSPGNARAFRLGGYQQDQHAGPRIVCTLLKRGQALFSLSFFVVVVRSYSFTCIQTIYSLKLIIAVDLQARVHVVQLYQQRYRLPAEASACVRWILLHLNAGPTASD